MLYVCMSVCLSVPTFCCVSFFLPSFLLPAGLPSLPFAFFVPSFCFLLVCVPVAVVSILSVVAFIAVFFLFFFFLLFLQNHRWGEGGGGSVVRVNECVRA